MFLSKIWIVLIGLVAGMAVAAAFVAPRAADRRIAELEGQRLDRAQYAAEQMLKNDAYRWITNYAAKLSRDAVLIESLDTASSPRASEPRMLNETVKRRLKTLVPDLAGAGIEAIVATDNKGRVVARVGERENDHGDGIGGAEAISDALRGYLSDDVWGSGGKLQRIAAVPVLSKTRDRIVGSIYVAAETGKRLAELWKKNLGVEIAILLRGQAIAATMPAAAFGQLPAEIESRAKEISESKRTQPIPLSIGNDRYLAVAAPFVGEAAEQDAYYVLVGKMAPPSNPLALLSSTKRDDLRWSTFPWVGLATTVLVLVGVGVFLQRWEIENPLARLRSEIQQLARGEIAKVQDTVYGGKLGGIARDVNAAIERITDVPAAKSETARKDLGAILGPPPGEQQSVFDLPQSHFGGGLSPPSPFAPPVQRTPPPVMPHMPPGPFSSGSPFGPPAGLGLGGRTPPPVTMPPAFGGPSIGPSPPPMSSAPGMNVPSRPFGLTPPPPASPPQGPGRLGATPSARLTSPPLQARQAPPPPAAPPPAPRQPSPPPASPPPARPAGSVTALLGPAFPGLLPDQPLPPLGGAAEGGDKVPGGGLERFEGGDHTPIVKLDGTGAPSGLAPLRAPTLEIRAVESTGIGGHGPTSGTDDEPDSPAAEETHVREVFDAYISTRQQCGESTGSVTLDKFRDKLAANRQQLVTKYGCRTARFSVYVKDGKAALKATPVR